MYTLISYLCLRSIQRRNGTFYIGNGGNIFIHRLIISIMFGWAIIPWWLLTTIFRKIFGIR